MPYYTYLYLRADGTPYYVGKGSGYRKFVRRGRVIAPPLDKSFVLTQEFPTEADAFAAEQFLIAYYGRKDLGLGILHNRTNGGEGTSGFTRVVSQKQREEHRCLMSGKPKSLVHRRHLGDGARIRWAIPSKGNDSRRDTLRRIARTSQPLANHTRWHVKRGIAKLECAFCEGSNAV